MQKEQTFEIGQRVLVNRGILSLYGEKAPFASQVLIDEGLYGMEASILEAGEQCAHIRMEYGYEGWVDSRGLTACLWPEDLEKMWVFRNQIDILEKCEVDSACLMSLPKGSVLCLAKDQLMPNEAGAMTALPKGWIKVVLSDGTSGYTKESFLTPYLKELSAQTIQDAHMEEAFRASLVSVCQSYLGTTYRWGGKTPQGIDCSGLVAMAYRFNGVTIYRDAAIKEGFPLHPIERECMKAGDLLFFKGHVAMYAGGERELYLHSTAKAGDDGFAVNSLKEGDPLYREDLAKGILEIGSIF